MLLAELVVRHTRRHMPTRRVALDGHYLPTGGPGHGATLLAAVVAEHLPALDDEQVDALLVLLDAARDGLPVPSRAMRHRLQTDTHGLDRSRHRVLGEDGRLVLELDVHGAPVPQVLGAVLAAATLPPTPRAAGLAAVRRAAEGRAPVPAGLFVVRRVLHASGFGPPPAPGAVWKPGRPPEEEVWVGVPSERRWAMEVLGFRPGVPVDRSGVNRRYRRLLRDAHPDHGGAAAAAADRISELGEARVVLLDSLASAAAVAQG